MCTGCSSEKAVYPLRCPWYVQGLLNKKAPRVPLVAVPVVRHSHTIILPLTRVVKVCG